MDLNHLKTIKWFSLTIFKEGDENLVVLECKTQTQAEDFLTLLQNYDFNFSIDRTNSESHRLIITFDNDKFRVSINPQKDILSKYFATKKINVVTTGFGLSGQLACLPDRIPIKGLHIFNLN